MKRLIWVLLVMGISFYGFGQEPIDYLTESDLNRIEAGKCFGSLRMNDSIDYPYGIYKESFVVEAIKPTFKEVEKTFILEDLYMNEDSTYRILTETAYEYFILGEKKSTVCISSDNKGFIFCSIEGVGKYQMYTKDELEICNYTIMITEIDRPSKIVQRFVTQKPKDLKDNQFFCEKGYWTENRGLVGCPCGPQLLSKEPTKFERVQRKLAELGYPDIVINGKLEDPEKAALTDLQKKNGLPVGQLDFETMRLLGIE